MNRDERRLLAITTDRLRRSSRLAALAIGAAALTCAVGASPASALTISPATTYATTSAGTTFTAPSTGQRLTCRASQKPMPLSAAGTGTITAGNASFSGCTNALLGAFTLTQTAGWNVAVVWLGPPAAPSGAALQLTLPSNGLTLSAPGCSLTIGGTYTKLVPVTTIPPVTTSSFAASGGGLSITSSSGATCSFLFPAGLALTVAETLTLSQAMTII